MSRFIRNAGTPATSGVDLSTCEINTSQSITANCFIGSGKLLCDTRWDLICSYAYCSGCIVACSFAIDLPIDNYNEFDLTVKGICNINTSMCMFFNLANFCGAITNVCVMCCCCLQLDANGTIGYINNKPNSYNCFVIYPDANVTQAGDQYYFNIKLRQVPCANTGFKNGVLVEYCNYALNVPCFKDREYKVYTPGCTTVNIAWDSSVILCCRLYSILFCSNANGTCPFNFANSCFTLYGWNNSLDNYSRLGG